MTESTTTRRRRDHADHQGLDPHDPGVAGGLRPWQLFKLRQANLLHLLDLKRAGHSPTRTEELIKPDATVVRAIAQGSRFAASPIGSPAAMCDIGSFDCGGMTSRRPGQS